MISFAQYTSADLEQLTQFHRKSFGANSYQANPNYLTWLYDENPNGPSIPTGWIARDETGTIVGCIHTMHLTAGNQETVILSLQNLIVDEEYRGGVGMLLVKRALKNAGIAIFPGVANDLAETYRAIRYEEVSTFWGRMPLRPLRVLFGLGMAKLGVQRALPQKLLTHLQDNRPTRDQISELSNRLANRPGNHIDWTPETVAWRFFSDTGPKHLLFMDPSNPEAFCVVSVGMRRNVCVVRPIDFGSNVEFLKSTLATLKADGAELCLAYGANDAARDTLQKLGVPELKNVTTSFVKRHSRCQLRDDFGLSAASTDLGFESIGAPK